MNRHLRGLPFCIGLVFGLDFYCPEYPHGSSRNKALACFGGPLNHTCWRLPLTYSEFTWICHRTLPGRPRGHQAVQLGRVYNIAMLAAQYPREPLPPHKLTSGLGTVCIPTVRFWLMLCLLPGKPPGLLKFCYFCAPHPARLSQSPPLQSTAQILTS